MLLYVSLQAEFESRCEMYEAQVTKMQRSLERGDTEKAKIEEELAKAMALNAQGDRQVRLTCRTGLYHANAAAFPCILKLHGLLGTRCCWIQHFDRELFASRYRYQVKQIPPGLMHTPGIHHQLALCRLTCLAEYTCCRLGLQFGWEGVCTALHSQGAHP